MADRFVDASTAFQGDPPNLVLCVSCGVPVIDQAAHARHHTTVGDPLPEDE